ncbi:AlkA N-terminal domain-containing protein [Halopseudomonas phragmitis]|uniref:DNA-3-methyladenine glycosylase II n=2 Tax=Pseudomonadaceae TaxID=135621 RepID=A0A1V0B3U6_9GAMM|nr:MULTISPECIES: AlkA N-terminal domain-containing protein [Pseudomonadaceae]AQZ94561.1 3-methyladenine DNA glycosylase 2 [Halopseudomonas phragmitis]RHW22234.1 DNA-3-methyladenine glycosylase 2 family protein [Pseudomonas jilinensis]
MKLSPATCYQAVQARDVRYDGRFFTCVKSTGVYCRPICPARTPRLENCLFVTSAAAAQEAGFRPCLRCRPESSPSSAAWAGTSAVVSRALALIEAGALDEASVEALAERLGLGSRHLRRLFMRHLGASPVAVAQTRRVLLAKQLIHQTRLPMTSVAMASGFGSVRRFNETFQRLYMRPPGSLRQQVEEFGQWSELSLLLAYRPPYDWEAMLAFLRQRALLGVELVDADSYQRSIRVGREYGWVRVRQEPGAHALRAHICVSGLQVLPQVIDRLRCLFDLKADPQVIRQTLAADPGLAGLLDKRPGLRLPGGWEPFEVAVRAVLGQQVTVGAGVRLAQNLVERLAEPVPEALRRPGITRFFPEPAAFVAPALNGLGMPGARLATLLHLAEAFVREPEWFARQADLESTLERWRAIPGIGDWTAQYIAIRALQETDAIPASDVALQRALGQSGKRPGVRQVLARAEAWRPWRAYALMHLWQADAEGNALPLTEDDRHATVA